MSDAHQKAIETLQLTFRALTQEDAEAYRALRLKALKAEGHWFTANIDEESARTLSQWKNVCAETTKHVTFAAFKDDQLMAATSIEAYDDHVAKWKSTISEPAIRGKGVVERLFEMCIDWCASHEFSEAIFTIHPDNIRSRNIQEKNGAVRIGEEEMRFADGHFAPAIWYKKNLG